jgi:hypothetical protein
MKNIMWNKDLNSRRQDDVDESSHITQSAAQELINKLKNVKRDNEQYNDYDEILKDIIQNIHEYENPTKKQQQQHVFYEKKYFDYLPNEIADSDDVTSREEEKLEDEDAAKKEVSSRDFEKSINDKNIKRDKRDVAVEAEQEVTKDDDDDDDKNIVKRRSKRQSFFVPLTHVNPFGNVHFFFPQNDPIFYNFPFLAAESRTDLSQRSFPQNNRNPFTPQNNPNARFHAPYNYYLPPATQKPPPPTYLPPTNNK